MGFAQESQVPERNQGYNEVTAQQSGPEVPNTQPSVDTTDRFGLQAAGKGFLLRRYNVLSSAAGNPYFTPLAHVLAQLERDVEDTLSLARYLHKTDTERCERAELQALKGMEYFQACLEAAGEGREWAARKRVIWPLTDELGFQLYKAAAGMEDLADFGAYLVRTDANISSISDAQDDERYQKRKFWSDLALAEAGELDDIIQTIEETEYHLPAMIRSGYRQQANLDTRTHLQGVRENVPAGDADDVKAQMKAQLMAGGDAF